MEITKQTPDNLVICELLEALKTLVKEVELYGRPKNLQWVEAVKKAHEAIRKVEDRSS